MVEFCWLLLVAGGRVVVKSGGGGVGKVWHVLWWKAGQDNH